MCGMLLERGRKEEGEAGKVESGRVIRGEMISGCGRWRMDSETSRHRSIAEKPGYMYTTAYYKHIYIYTLLPPPIAFPNTLRSISNIKDEELARGKSRRTVGPSSCGYVSTLKPSASSFLLCKCFT